jgi:Nucleotidyl transferase of unknown function (DUF2204)
MFQDFKELLSFFNAHDVKYLVVGGYAVSFHAQPRFTKDLDLFIKADAANALAVFSALTSFGIPLGNITVEDLSNPAKFFRFGNEPIAVDVLPGIDGLDFDTAWENRVEGIVDSKSGLSAFFVSSADLIAAKIAAGRPQDLADIDALRKSAQGG